MNGNQALKITIDAPLGSSHDYATCKDRTDTRQQLELCNLRATKVKLPTSGKTRTRLRHRHSSRTRQQAQ